MERGIAFDHRAGLGNVAQPDRRCSGNRNGSFPTRSAGGVRRSALLAICSSFAGAAGSSDVSKARSGKVRAMTSRSTAACLSAEQSSLRFVGEFEADPAALDPAHRAFDGAVLAQVKVDPVPQARLEIGRDHRAAARQIDQLDRHGSARRGSGSPARPAAGGGPASRVSPRRVSSRDHRDAVQRVGLGALGLLGLTNGRFFGRCRSRKSSTG